MKKAICLCIALLISFSIAGCTKVKSAENPKSTEESTTKELLTDSQDELVSQGDPNIEWKTGWVEISGWDVYCLPVGDEIDLDAFTGGIDASAVPDRCSCHKKIRQH